MAESRILVVGAGIAGLAAARAPAGAGPLVEVVEREPAWGDMGAGMYLPGNAARALRTLGLEQACRSKGSRSPGSVSATIAAGCSSRSSWRSYGTASDRASRSIARISMPVARGGGRGADPDGSRRSRAARAKRDGLDRVRRRHRGRVRARGRRGRSPARCAGSPSAPTRPPGPWDRWAGASSPRARRRSRRGRCCSATAPPFSCFRSGTAG
jgi:FAD binding domain